MSVLEASGGWTQIAARGELLRPMPMGEQEATV